MVRVAGYEVIAKLHESSRSLVYRGQRDDQRSSILKVMQAEYPSLEELGRYRLEYEIINRLNLDGIAKAYGLEPYQNGLVLVLEDFGGASLQRLMQTYPFQLTEFLEMAIAITEILGQVHAASIIHKDINPANIVLNPDLSQVKLIDFGNATVLSRENPTLRNPNVLEGTLAYLSPEQTGRMNRSLDYRTDFYSLGATFYEVLTGNPPFNVTDAMELIHCHLARQPEPPHSINLKIPEMVSQIILKLLAKNAEDRYQSAYGIKIDLQHCLEQLRTKGEIAPFALAQNDASGRFQIPQKLYGRAREVEMLMAGFERVAGEAIPSTAGSSELMLVSGYSGIGKSALVQEVYKPITRRNGYFISGKFDQFQRNIPYSALIQVFQELMRQLLTESPAQIDRWRSQLLKALGMNGQVVIDVIPEVELIISQQPAVEELAARETQNRFNLVFQNFIQVFTQAEHPLVIFLDDLQWADSASLRLIQLLMTAPESCYLFLVGAYRSNEVNAVHPLRVTIEEIRKAGGAISQIELLPLDLATVQQVIAEAFDCDWEKAKPLSELVMQITDGNPFFMNEFLKSLYEKDLLNFDGQLGGWQWDLNQIRNAHIPDNVVELMAGKIQKLNAPSQQVLKLAACIGNSFDSKTLAIVSEKSQSAIAADLWQGVQEGLILPLGDSYKFTGIDQQQIEQAMSFKFLHDRVQQAAYSLIPEGETQVIHQKIGQSLLTHVAPEEQEEKIFDIVNQLNMGIGLITQQAQRDKLAALNLTAGTKAKDSTAYDSALRYLLTGIGLLGSEGWQIQYDLKLALHESAAEAAYLTGDFEEAERLVEQILHHAKTILDRVKAYQVRSNAYSAQNNMEAAIDTFVSALKRLGETVPRRPSRLTVGLELLRTRFWVIGNRPVASLETLPPMTNPYKLAIIQLASSGLMASVNVDPLFLAVVVLRVINMIVRYGSSPLSAVQGIAYGVMLRVAFGDTEGAYAFGRLSLRLIDRLDAKFYRTFTILGYESCIRHWKEPLRRSLPELLGAYTEGMELGNLEPAGLAASVYCFHQFFLGEPLPNVAEAYQQYVTLLVRLKQEMTVYSMQPWQQLVLNLQGLATDPACLTGTAFNETKLLPLFLTNKLGIPLYYTYVAKAIWLYHAGDYAGALQATQLAMPHQESSPVTTPYANQNFYNSLACLALYSTASQLDRQQYLRQVAKNQRRAKRWAKKCPENYRHRYDLVEAERWRILGKLVKAIDHYDRAIQGAKEQDYINEVALANELAAKFCLSFGREKFAQVYLLEARHHYLRWGATFKVEALDARYPQLRDRALERSGLDTRTTQVASTSSRKTSSGSHGFDLDLDTVFKASQAISGEIVLDKLLTKLLKLVLENAGAQKGCLLLSNQEEWRIEAEGRIDSEDSILLQSRPLDLQALPLSIINYVQRTREDLVLRDAASEGLFVTDPYIIQTQPRSILCTPILNQGNLTGILYLENNLATDAFTPERLTVLSILSAQAAIALENALFYRTLEQKVEERTGQLAQANEEITLLNDRLQSENLRMGAELALTRQIQQMILPKEHELSQIPDLEISGFMEPADEVGGDYYDVLQKDGHVKIGIGDVTGHGLESGVLMIMVQTAVRSLLQTNEMNPQVFLDQVNHTIYDNVQRMGSDKNLTLALLDYRDGCLSLSGQHEEMIVVREGIVERIETIDLGFPIGLESEIAQFVNQVQIQLNPGDVVVLYTDGITEAENDLREQYGLERLCEVVSQNWRRSTHEIRQAVIDDVRYHIGNHKIYDDMTLLILKQK